MNVVIPVIRMEATEKFKLIAWLIQLFLGFTSVTNSSGKLPGMLYPRSSESRSVRHLDGMWNFRIDDSQSRNVGFEQQWYSKSLKQVLGSQRSEIVNKCTVQNAYKTICWKPSM